MYCISNHYNAALQISRHNLLMTISVTLKIVNFSLCTFITVQYVHIDTATYDRVCCTDSGMYVSIVIHYIDIQLAII